jgi:hypothetical protein
MRTVFSKNGFTTIDDVNIADLETKIAKPSSQTAPAAPETHPTTFLLTGTT